MRRYSISLLAACAAVSFAEPALATTSIWTGTGSNDAIGWGQLGPTFTTVANGSGVTSDNGVNATVTNSFQDMQRLDQGSGWNGSFGPGEELLYSGDFAAETMTITFAQAVMAVGAQVQSNFWGPFTARITLNDGSFFDIAGVAGGTGLDTNPFLGAISDSANITSITFGMLTNGDAGFAISELALISAPVPEPATWAMMILGFGAAGLTIRRRRKLSLATAAA